MSSLVRRGNLWYLRWSENGIDHGRSTKIRIDLDPRGLLARQVQRDFDSSRARQTAGIEDEVVSIADGFSRYLLSIRQATPGWQAATRARVARLTAWLSDRRIETWDRITPALLDDLISERSMAVAPKTVVYDLDLIKATARLLNRSRKIRPLPVDSWPSVKRAISPRPDRIGAYSPSEIEAILRYLNTPRRQKWRAIILALAYLGCRWSELVRLRVSDVRLEPPAVRIESRKTARHTGELLRWVEIHPRLLPVILEQIAGKRLDDRVFGLPGGAIQQQAIKLMERVCSRLGIQYRRLHGLRHAWITSLLRAGVPLAIVMRAAGHRNIATTQRYLHVAADNPGWITNALPTGDTPTDTPDPQKTAENGIKSAG